MADKKLSAFTSTTNSNGGVPIFVSPGVNNIINLRDAILALVTGGLIYKGSFDASTATELPIGNSGDMYAIVNSGTNPSIVNGLSLATGDFLICNTDGTPAATPGNRDLVPGNSIPDSTELIKGKTAYATLSETEAKLVSTKAVVPSALANFVLKSEVINQNPQLVTYRVQMIFDNALTDLPLTTATQIDGQTVANGDLVYVKNALNSATIDSVYKATVSGSAISWVYQYTVGTNSVYSEDGTEYAGNVLVDNNVQYLFNELFASTINTGDVVTNNIIINEVIDAPNYNLNHIVNVIFDDSLNALPLIDTTQIDGHTVVNGDFVYVKNSSDPTQVGKIFEASVDGSGNITRTGKETVKSGDTIYSQDGDTYGDTIIDASSTTITEITNLQTDNIITNTYNFNYNINVIFDDSLNALPLIDTTQIDGHTVVNGDLVYVKNSSDPTQVGKIFEASVDGSGNIIRIEKQTLNPGDTIYSQDGDTYGDTINNFSNTTVQNGINSSVLPKKLELSDAGTNIILTSEPLGGADGITVLYKNSGTNFFETTDYTYNPGTKTVTLNTALTTGETVQVRRLEGIIALGGNDSDVVHNTGNETIDGIKTFLISPFFPTPARDDNSTKGATTAYVDRSILGATAVDILVNQDFYMGENGAVSKTVFIERNITSADATLVKGIGDTSENTRIAIRQFGSSIVNNRINMNLGVVGNPSTNCVVRLEIMEAGQPNGNLAHPNATATLTTAEAAAKDYFYFGNNTFDTPIDNNINFTGFTTATGNYNVGYKIKSLVDQKLTIVTIHASCTATKCRLYNETHTLLATATITSHTATFNYILGKDIIYFIESDNSGSNYTRVTRSQSFPIATSSIIFLSGSQNGTALNYIYNIETLKTEAMVYEDLGLTEGTPYALVLSQTADTVNTTNYYTIGYSAQQTNTRTIQTYNGSVYSAPLSFSDSFTGTTVDTTKRPTINGAYQENGYLNFATSHSIFSTVFNGEIATTAEIGTQPRKERIRINYRLQFDTGDFAQIQYATTTYGDPVLNCTIHESGTDTKNFQIFVGQAPEKVKIYYQSNGNISFYHWVSSWVQIGTTTLTTLTGSCQIFMQGDGRNAYNSSPYGFCNYVYVVGNDFATQIPVITNGTNFVYVNSGLFLEQLLSYTDASLFYKTKLFGILQSNTSIGARGQIGFEGIDSHQSGLTLSAIQYLSDTAGEISQTPGTNKFIVGEALDNSNLKINKVNLLQRNATVGASPYVYQNIEPNEQKVMVAGGTVSNIAYSRNGIDMYTQATTTNTEVILAPGDYVKVTYSALPNFIIYNK